MFILHACFICILITYGVFCKKNNKVRSWSVFFSAIYIKEEIHCDKFTIEVEPSKNDFSSDGADDAFNAIISDGADNASSVTHEILIKEQRKFGNETNEEPMEQDLVSD